MAKGNDQKRCGELESTMASKNKRGGSQSRRTIDFCCKRSEVSTKTEIVSQSKQQVNGNHE
jgi:hypothetical protein